MHACVSSWMLIMAVLLPLVGSAQVYQPPTSPPQVTAANATWQIRGEAIFYAGDFYYPTGPTVFFDRFVMVRTGIYQGVPLYADTTLEPYSVVYVPIGGNVMRPYERRRAGQLAGTVGSRVPSFPIQRDVEVSNATGTTGIMTPPTTGAEATVAPEAERPVATRGTIVANPAVAARSPIAERSSRSRKTIVESIPRPRSNAGIWIEFDGMRWYSAGDAVPYAPSGFRQVGEYHGFPVYRAIGGDGNTIYVPAILGGGLTPYHK